MKTSRRFYFYLLSLISSQVIIWAVVSLLRTIFDTEVVASSVDWLAGGIAFVAVGVPIFWLHWSTVQRDAQRDQEEASSRIRALFLYVTPLATGIPITYALLAILNRLVVMAFGLPVTSASLGGGQTNLDNLLAIAVNLIFLVYFWRVLQHDWETTPNQENLVDFRRLHRHIWMVYGLGVLIFGVQQILRYIFYLPQEFGHAAESGLAAGLALILVGLPIFLKALSIIQKSVIEKNERTSSLRLMVLFVLSLFGMGFSLAALGILLSNGLRWMFQVENWNILAFIDKNASPLSVIISMGVVWRYFRRELRSTIAYHEDALHQASLRRIYNSILSFAGLVVSFLGVLSLLGHIIENLFNLSIGTNAAILSDALALLLIGVPLWLKYWQEIQWETTRSDEIGVAACKSVLRKTYLYLVLFATVLGSMLSAGWWIYGILNALLGQMPTHFWMNFFQQLRVAALFAVFLVYHLKVLRTDNRESRVEKTEEFRKFPVLVLKSGDSSSSEAIMQAIQQKSPHLAVNLHQLDLEPNQDPLPDSAMIVIPASLTLSPPEQLRLHLQTFTGKVLVVPENLDNWHWLGTSNKDQQQQAQEIAYTIHQLSENQPIRPSPISSPWVIVAYILAGLFVLQIVAVVIATLINLILN